MRFIKSVRNRLWWICCIISFLLYFSLMIFPIKSGLAFEPATEDTAKILEDAKKEGKLTWYVTMDVPDAEKLIRRFNGKYPFIEVSYYRSGDAKMMTRILAEAGAQKHLFDIIHIPVLNAETLKRKGLLSKYLSSQRQYYSEGSAKDPEGYWTSIYLNIHVIGYNKKAVTSQDVPKSFEDFLLPKWKGNIGMDDKAFYWFGGMLKNMGEEKGLEYMKKLSDQEIQFRTGKTLVAQLVSAGELKVGVPLFNHRIEEMKSKGAPLEWVAIDPVIPDINPIAISAHAPHPNAAKLFVDFILSKDGQETIASLYRIPARTDVDPIVPKLKKGIKLMPFDASIVDDYAKYVKLYRKTLMKR